MQLFPTTRRSLKGEGALHRNSEKKRARTCSPALGRPATLHLAQAAILTSMV